MPAVSIEDVRFLRGRFADFMLGYKFAIDEIVTKIGGRFKLTALIQKRLVEIIDGARPLIDRQPGMTDLEVVIGEIMQDKITIDYDASNLPKPGTRD